MSSFMGLRHVWPCAFAVFVAGTFVVGADTPSKRDRQRIDDSLYAGYSLSMTPQTISSQPWIVLEPQVDADMKTCSVAITTGRGNLAIKAAFTHMRIGSQIPMHGKIFEITRMTSKKDELQPLKTRSEVYFQAQPKSEMLKLISGNGDTFFLPYLGSARICDVKLDIYPAPKSGLGKHGQVVVYAEPVPNAKSQVDGKGDWISKPQVVGDGDVIQYGAKGVKIRRVVRQDGANGIVGWVEIFDEELAIP